MPNVNIALPSQILAKSLILLAAYRLGFGRDWNSGRFGLIVEYLGVRLGLITVIYQALITFIAGVKVEYETVDPL